MKSNYENYKEYQNSAVQMMTNAGFEVTDTVVGSIFDHWLKGTSMSEIERLVKNGSHHALTPHQSFDTKLVLLKKQLNDYLNAYKADQSKIEHKIVSASEEARIHAITADAVRMIQLTQSIAIFTSTISWLNNLQEHDVPAAQQFYRVFHRITKDLAFHANNVTVLSTSEQANLETRAKAAAYGVLVEHFASMMEA